MPRCKHRYTALPVLTYLSVRCAPVLVNLHFRCGLAGLLFLILFAHSAVAHPLFESFTLKNGMEVVVIENHRIPAINHTLWYRVGAADDPPGKTGLAHFLEHMMFQGTPKYPSGEYSKIVAVLGGNHNAFTSHDFTAFYVNIAKAHLPKVMELEADRMQHLNPPPKEFAREREVIIEERRATLDNKPEAQLAEQMNAALFLNHPYHHSIIGWKHEMEGLTREDVLAFHKTFYHPANAILVVAGDITAAELKPLVEKYYGAIPAGEKPLRQWQEEPVHNAAHKVMLRNKSVKQAQFVRAYLAPSLVHGDSAEALPLFVMAQILGGGETGRLYQSLVVRQKIATRAEADYSGISRGPATMEAMLTPAPGISAATLANALQQEIDTLIKNGVTDEEFARAKTLLKAETLYARDGLQSMGNIMGQLRVIDVDAKLFEEWPALIDAVTKEQVVDAARRVFDDNNSVTGQLLPEGEAAHAQ